MRAVRRPPVERPAVADPGDETAVKVHRCPVLRLVRARNGCVHRNNALQRGPSRGLIGGKFVIEGDLDRDIPFRDDDAAEMFLELGWAATQGVDRVEAPKRSRPESRMKLVRKLLDIDAVMGYPRDGRRKRIGRRNGDPAGADAAQRLSAISREPWLW